MPGSKQTRLILPLSLFLLGVGGSLIAPVLFREARSTFGATSGVVSSFWAVFLAGAAVGSIFVRSRERAGRPAAIWFAPLSGLLLPFLPSLGSGAASYATLLGALFLAGAALSRFVAAAAGAGDGMMAPPLAGGAFLGSIAALRFLPADGNVPLLAAGWIALVLAAIALHVRLASAATADEMSSEHRTGKGGAIPFPVALFFLSGGALGLFLTGAGRLLDMLCGATMRMELIEAAAAAGGIAAGALAGRVVSRRSGRGFFSPAALLAGLSAALVVFLHGSLPDLFVDLSGGHGYRFSALLHAKEAVAALLLVPAAFFTGALFSIGTRNEGTGVALSRFGAVAAGLAVTAFGAPFCIAFGGIQGNLFCTSALFFLVALVGVSRSSGRKPEFAARGAAALFLIVTLLFLVRPPEWKGAVLASGAYRQINALLERNAEGAEEGVSDSLSFYIEGRSSTYAVMSDPVGKTLLRNGSDDTGDRLYSSVDILLGRLPLLFRPDAGEVLILGAGRGITAGSLLKMEVDSVLVVEPEAARLAATHALGEENGEYWTDRRLRVIDSDPGRFLATRSGKYELVIAQPYDVWSIADAVRGTEEYYSKVKSRLADGGIFSAWVPLVGVGEDDVKSMLATITAVFSRIVVFQAARHDGLVVLAGEEPFRLPVKTLAEQWRGTGFGDEFATAGISAAPDLIPFARFDETACSSLVARAPLNDGRKTPVEFGAERALSDLTGRNYLDLIRSVPWDARSILDFDRLNDESISSVLYEAGRAFRRTRDPEHGYPFAEEAYRIAPSTGRAILLAHFVKVLDGDMDRVLSIEREALVSDPDNGMLIRSYADDLYLAGAYDECVTYLSDVIGRGFGQPWCYLIRGKAHAMLDHLDEAIRDISKAKELDRLQDNRGNINYFLGMAYKKRGDLEESSNFLSRAVGRNPRHRNARYNFGENKVKLGKLAPDEFDANYYTPFNRARADSLYRLASRDFFKPDRAADVERDLTLIINTTPNHMGAYLLLAELYWRAGNDAKEGEAISRMVAQFQGSRKCLDRLDNYLARTGGEKKRARYDRIVHNLLN